MSFRRGSRAARVARHVMASVAGLASFSAIKGQRVRAAPDVSHALRSDWERLGADMRRAADKVRDAKVAPQSR